MAFLKIDGWTVPTAKGGAQADAAVGDIDNAFDGTPMADIRYRQRTHQHTTTALDAETANALVRMLMREGQSWDWVDPDDNTATPYSFKGLGPAALTAVYGYYIAADGYPVQLDGGTREGKFSNSLRQVTSITNLLASDQRDPVATGFTAVAPGSISDSTDHKLVGTNSVKTIALNTGAGLQSDTIAASATTQYTASFYIYSETALDLTLNLVDSVGTITTASKTTTAGYWTRYTLTGTTNGGATTLRFQVLSANGSMSWWIDACQIVTGSSPRPWISDGASTTTDYVYSLGSGWSHQGEGFTVAGWFNVGSSGTGNLFELRSSGAVEYSTFFLTHSNMGSGSSHSDVIGLSDTYTYTWDNNWHHVAFVYRRKRLSDGAREMVLYIDGVAVKTLTGSDNLFGDLARIDTLEIADGGVVGKLTGYVGDFRLYPFSASASLVAGWASQTVAPGRCPRLRLTGDSIEQEDGVEAEGTDVSSRFAGRRDSGGTWRSQTREVSFQLREVPG